MIPLRAAPASGSMEWPCAFAAKNVLGKNIGRRNETLAINAHAHLVLMKARLTRLAKFYRQRTHEKSKSSRSFFWARSRQQGRNWLEFSSRASFWRVRFLPKNWTPRPGSTTVPASAAIRVESRCLSYSYLFPIAHQDTE